MEQDGAAEQAECIFCRILQKKVPVEPLVETEMAIIIKDRAPVAKDHVLVIGKGHAADITQATVHTAYEVLKMAQEYGKKHMPGGFRIVINTGGDAGQTVRHFHAHVLGGEKLKDL